MTADFTEGPFREKKSMELENRSKTSEKVEVIYCIFDLCFSSD